MADRSLDQCILVIHWITFFVRNVPMALAALAADGVTFWIVVGSMLAKVRIKKGIEQIASGNLEYRIELKGLRGTERNIAENVNDIGSGLNRAIDEAMRNERLKTDLITNVSHDIKTPLTSIINYVDILKRSDIADEKILGYLDILEVKAQRLKTLTEDVVEASKVSSGNITLEYMDIDFREMVQQTEGEMAEKFAARNLSVVLNLPEEAAVIHVDGRRMWRVLENIFGNAAKYAMPGTRIYADLRTDKDEVIFSLKNVSEYPLNFSADELTERFVRGDVARTTEGSGLGLSIARSLTQLQKGEFVITIDGDLFKAQVIFPQVRQETRAEMRLERAAEEKQAEEQSGEKMSGEMPVGENLLESAPYNWDVMVENDKNLTAKEQLYLIKEGISIKNIQKPVEKVQLYALKWRRASISDIRNPTEKAQLITIRKDKELFLYIKNPTITVCQEVARAYCGNIEVPADRRIIKPTQKLVSSLQDTEGYVYIKEMSLDYNKGDQYINNESDKIMNWKKQKQKQIIDDYKYEIGIAKERGTEPNIKIEESGIQQENGHKQVNTRIDYSNKPQDKYNIEALSNKEVIGTISYYDFNGKVCEVIEYNTVESYLKSIKDELNSNPNGFKYETLTTDANIRKSVDDIVYGAYGEDNPHPLEWYSSNNTKAAISPEQYLSEERNKIMREYAKNPFGALDKENISAEGMDKWAAVTNKYMEMKTNISTKQIELQSSGCKTLIYDVFYSSGQKESSHYRILDKSTGKTESINVGDIDLEKQSPETLKKLLSGQQTEMTNKSGTNSLVTLNKTITGWGISAVKQVFNSADNSAGI